MRDSRTGYFIPARYGIGLRPDGRVVGTSPPPSSGNSGRHSGQETIFGVFHVVLGSWREIFENGDRGSTQNFDTNLMSIVVWPGKPFSKKCLFYFNSKVTMLVFPGTCSTNNPSPRSLAPGATRPPPVFPGYEKIE